MRRPADRDRAWLRLRRSATRLALAVQRPRLDRSALAAPARSAERTFAVGDQRQVSRIAEDSPRRTKLCQRLGPLLGEVRGDPDRFPNGADT